MEWSKDPLNSSSPLTFEEGLQTIDAFYTEERHLLEDTAPLPDRQTGKDDDCSTLMEDIDQLTAPNSEQPQPEDNNQNGLAQDTTSLNLTAATTKQTAEATFEDHLVQDNPPLDQSTAPDQQISAETALHNRLAEDSIPRDQSTTLNHQTLLATAIENTIVQDSTSSDRPTFPKQQPGNQPDLQDDLVQSEASLEQSIISNEQAETEVAVHDSPVQNETASDQPPSSDTALHNSLAQDGTSSGQLNIPKRQPESQLILQDSIVESEASHEQAVPELPSEDNLTLHTAQVQKQSPESEPSMTPHLKTEEQLPSSEGKSSMMDEMRSEERRHPLINPEEAAAAAAIAVASDIQLPGLASEEADDVPQLDILARSHRPNLHTELNAVTIKDDVATSVEVVGSKVSTELRMAKAGESSKKRITRSTKQQAFDEQDMFPDLPLEDGKEGAVESAPGGKRKRENQRVSHEVENSAPAAEKHKLETGHIGKKRVTRGMKQQASDEQDMFPDLQTEVAKEEAADRVLGGKSKRNTEEVPDGVEDSLANADTRTVDAGHIVKKRMMRSTRQQVSGTADVSSIVPAAAQKNGLADSASDAERKLDMEDPSADSDQADNPAKKAKKPARRSTSNLAATDDTTTESPANRRFSRNVVGKREIAALESQKPQRSNSNRPETRAEVAKGPNAGLAVKERRRAVERKDSNK